MFPFSARYSEVFLTALIRCPAVGGDFHPSQGCSWVPILPGPRLFALDQHLRWDRAVLGWGTQRPSSGCSWRCSPSRFWLSLDAFPWNAAARAGIRCLIPESRVNPLSPLLGIQGHHLPPGRAGAQPWSRGRGVPGAGAEGGAGDRDLSFPDPVPSFPAGASTCPGRGGCDGRGEGTRAGAGEEPVSAGVGWGGDTGGPCPGPAQTGSVLATLSWPPCPGHPASRGRDSPLWLHLG